MTSSVDSCAEIKCSGNGRKAMLGVYRKAMLGVYRKAMLGVYRKAMLGVCRKAMLGVWIQGTASLSPFLIG